MKLLLRALFVIVGLMFAASFVAAQDAIAPPAPAPTATPQTLRVATRVIPPFITEGGEQLSGFSAELWAEVLKETGNPNFQWVIRKNIKEILATVENKEADVAIAAISITAEREQKFDFSLPMFDSGLQIMVPKQTDNRTGLGRFIDFLMSDAMKFVLALLGILIVGAGHIAWYLERGDVNSHEIDDNYIPGIFQGMAWAAGAFAGQQSSHLQSVFGRTMSIVAIISSVVFLTYIQATLSSAMTVESLRGGIQGPDDLPGKRVGTTAGSTSAAWLKDHSITPQEYQKVTDAYEALAKAEIDAVVFDAPVLLYYASREGLGKVEVVGEIFRKENYGILFPQGSSLRKPVNTALLKLRENGTYDKIYAKWFGRK